MPNHVENRLTIKGTEEQIKEIKDFLKGKYNDGTECNIDFNNITPMPKWVFNENLTSKDEEKYGKENCWYEWNRKNWGTKWNAYKSNLEDENNIVRFSTAWNNVSDLMRKLGFIFPNVEFEYAWADEDFGYNVGYIIFKDTQLIKEFYPVGGTKEAYDLACNIRKETLQENYINENYEYDESLEEV